MEKLCEVLKMEFKTYTPDGLKFVFEKIEFKILHYIQHAQGSVKIRLACSKALFKSLLINYFILEHRHTF